MPRPWLTVVAALLLIVSVSELDAQALPGDLIQSAVFAGTQPIDLCHLPGTNDLYVLDASNGSTYRYDLTNLAAGPNLTISNPVGTAATTGITSDGFFLYFAVTGHAQTFWRTDLLGGSATALGSISLPGFGSLVGICLDSAGNLWANDVTNDTYSKHSIADGSYLGVSFPHPDGSGSGSGLAFRSDCELFEIPHGGVGAGRVTALTSVLGPDGVPIDGIDVSAIGPLIRGVEAVLIGSTGLFSIFLVEGSTNQIYEMVGIPACPVPEIPELMDIVRCSQPVPVASTACGPLAAPLAVSDLATTIDTIAPTQTFPIGDLDLALDLTHPAPNELTITLTAPNGTALTLHNGLPGGGNFLVVFDDEGAPYGSSSLSSGARMRPAGPGLLSAFHGIPFAGLWTLSVTDGISGNSGALNSWCLTASPNPGLLIDPVGTTVTDTITITEGSTTIRDVNVGLEITHPFIADLTVALTGPTGTSLTLHDESVITDTVIVKTYDDDGFGDSPDGPGLLQDFVGTTSNGVWTLSALDSFSGETGTLDGWCLHLDEFTEREFCHSPPRTIDCVTPGTLIDQTTPVTSSINTLLTGAIRDLDVALDIGHTWIGDLDITVESPAATSIVLLSSGSGNLDDIHTTFDDEGSPFTPVLLPGSSRVQPQGPGSLADFDGETIDGTWNLSITDATSGDDGILQSWCLDTQTPLAVSNAGGPLLITYEVPDDILIEDLELHLRIEHPLPGQLQMSLSSPTGAVITLMTVSPAAATGVDVTFAADGVPFDSALIGNGLRMQPAVGTPLDFVGASMQGTWTLTVIDAIAGADGVLTDACLRILGDEIPCQPPILIVSADTISGPSPLAVDFSTTASGTQPITIAWNFADGTSTTGTGPLHTFQAEGSYPVTVTATNACGGTQTTILIQVCNPIESNATASTLLGAPPLTVDFTSGATGTAPRTYFWEFGDGATSTVENPSHIFTTAGTYPVNFTGTNACGLVQRQFLITVCEPVTALPTATPQSGAPPLEVQFDAGASGSGPFFYTWNFGDGVSSNAPNPTHTYATPGDYVATLTVINSCGTDVRVLPIGVCAPVTTAATASTTGGAVPLTVNFATNEAGSAPIAVNWDFGDGSSSTESLPSHTYTTGGIFTATVTATNGCGTTTESFTITPCAPVTVAPTATPDSGSAPLVVSFDANALGTGPLNAFWTFGDGSISTELNPIHTFSTDGLYPVQITVTNSCGSASGTVQVAVCGLVSIAPTADLTIGNAPLTVNFASGELGSSPIATTWDFGDTNSSSGATTVHTFSLPGSYLVSVLSTNTCGSATGTVAIEVCDAVGAAPTAAVGANGIATAVQFSALPSGSGPFNYVWNFGDGATSTLENPLHDYGVGGLYAASVTVSNPCGTATASITADLCSPPNAGFSANTTFGIAPFCVDFTDLSSGQIASSLWSFGDGNTDPTIGDTAHTFTSAGTFDVTLTVANACAVESTATVPQMVEVLAPGDVNADGALDITDPIALLGYIFGGQAAPECLRIADINLDGIVDITDPISLLFWQFAAGPAPLSPPCGQCNF